MEDIFNLYFNAILFNNTLNQEVESHIQIEHEHITVNSESALFPPPELCIEKECIILKYIH